MNLSRFIIAWATGIFIYLLGTGIFGAQGYLALQQKIAERDSFLEHLVELEYLQSNLAGEVLALEKNPQVIEREANSRGYLREGQVWVRLGTEKVRAETPSPGSEFRLVLEQPLSQSYILAASLAGFLLALTLGFLFRPKDREGIYSDTRSQVASLK